MWAKYGDFVLFLFKACVTCSSGNHLSKLNSGIRGRTRKFWGSSLLNYPFPVSSPDPNIPRSPIFRYILRDLHSVPSSLDCDRNSSFGGGGGWRACSRPQSIPYIQAGQHSREALSQERNTKQKVIHFDCVSFRIPGIYIYRYLRTVYITMLR